MLPDITFDRPVGLKQYFSRNALDAGTLEQCEHARGKSRVHQEDHQQQYLRRLCSPRRADKMVFGSLEAVEQYISQSYGDHCHGQEHHMEHGLLEKRDRQTARRPGKDGRKIKVEHQEWNSKRQKIGRKRDIAHH